LLGSSLTLSFDLKDDEAVGTVHLNPPTTGGWVGILHGWNPYFPWYPTISAMIIPTITTYISNKLLNYLEYTKKFNLNAHVLVF
jgi:hypothetical protein